MPYKFEPNSCATSLLQSFSVSVQLYLHVWVIRTLIWWVDNVRCFSLVVVFHHFTQSVKSFFYRLSAFCAALHVRNVVLLCEIFRLLFTHFSLFFQVFLVAHENHLSGFRCDLAQVFDPVSFIKQILLTLKNESLLSMLYTTKAPLQFL